jgi:hypothetical protein
MAGAMFKALSKTEFEYTSAVCKFLRWTKPVREDNPDARTAVMREERLWEALSREEQAVTFCKSAAESATEERMKDFFTPLAEVEAGHIDVSNPDLGIARD